MKPTDWDEAYKRLDKIEPPPPEDVMWKLLAYDAATLFIFICGATFLVQWAIS
jgi:hypothetical protein